MEAPDREKDYGTVVIRVIEKRNFEKWLRAGGRDGEENGGRRRRGRGRERMLFCVCMGTCERERESEKAF